MKKLMLLLMVGLLATGLSENAVAQDLPGMDASPVDVAYYPSRVALRAFANTDEAKNAQPVIRVMYSRPQKKGRVVFGELEKFGSVWRAGANESTEIMFMRDVMLGDTTIPAGRYTLHVGLEQENWTIYVSSDLDTWGSYSFNPEASTVAMLEVPTEATSEVVEAFSIAFTESEDGAHMIMAWDETMVRVPFKF